ncbi:hypothetical protein GO495_05750 [Chitinophaga oryziterrae]|uniref:Glycosyltransferase family 8 protein n=1 Tax=Chitinophaga oryziterrae TaxID=1031224 RepID=A0A6N8J643_9BACT|nr:hypothetical protein [Chitinophaga oryziterrae]MVT40078.1 hypothetical protein [Chitinophaga oryziterrae]
MKKAIVTLCVGKMYEDLFDVNCRKNWQLYCDKFGYDLIVINELLDKTDRAFKRSAAWQKLLVLSQDWSSQYDRIVWVDADILINCQHATDIADGVPIDKVGAVDAYSIPSKDLHDISLERRYAFWKKNNIAYLDNRDPNSYYTNRGINAEGLKNVVHTGVMVCSPHYHKAIFEDVYNHYEDANKDNWNYEMPALSYELIKADIVHWISPRFNFIVISLLASFYPDLLQKQRKFTRRVLNRLLKFTPYTYTSKYEKACLKNIYDLSIFMHFAGNASMMKNKF